VKTPHRRHVLQLAGGAAALPAMAHTSWAQAYPSRPARIVVGFPAGGGNDIVARLIAQWLSDKLGQQFIVENRPGAGSNVGTEAVVHAPPDGYTLLLAFSTNSINATLYDKLNFNFIRDIAPVASIARGNLMVVTTPSFPATTIPELIAAAKANPGKIDMASTGIGTPTHVAGELFRTMTGTNMQHVPYRGDTPALTDLMGGQVQTGIVSLGGSIELAKTGKLRALAVTTAARSEAMPDVPTVAEFVPGFEASTWYGIGAPRNTPAEIINTLNREITASLADPKVKARLAEVGTTVLPGSVAEFTQLIADETDKWAKVIRAANIKPS
jgi:tripartite-type tricarboxylate transporter receptor subunit TctC